MKLSDYVADWLSENGINQIFMVTGGGAMHLNHSFGVHPNLDCVFNHHEQACAMAAESYFRVNNRLAVANVTSGPGGTNAITGVYGAFVDSIGMVVISGQVKYETTVPSTGLNLRQYGDQELDIQKLVEPITKYVRMVTDPSNIRYELEKAVYIAKNGRPGPVWLDIPLNVQGANIDPKSLHGFDSSEFEESWKKTDLESTCRDVCEKLLQAKRPVIYAGGGVRISGRHDIFLRILEKLHVPVVTGFNSQDVIWNEHPSYVGIAGSLGDRAGNFAVQNSDLLLVLGNRLSIRQVSYNWKNFAREASIIWVDVDDVEMHKPSVNPAMRVHSDLADFMPALLSAEYKGPTKHHQDWLVWCKERKLRYPVILAEYSASKNINPYVFVHSLYEQLNDSQLVVTGNGTACVVGFQAAKLKRGQRIWTNSGCATMGYDLPAAIGAFKGLGGNQASVVCLAGDGSIMMNLQELQTISGNNLPIKIFILNNDGYVSIAQTHRNFFNGVEVGGGPDSGVTFPDFKKISYAFDIPFIRCSQHSEIADSVSQTLNAKGPAICEVVLDKMQPFAPKLGAKQLSDGRIISPPLEDLSPFLSRAELSDNMIIPMVSDE